MSLFESWLVTQKKKPATLRGTKDFYKMRRESGDINRKVMSCQTVILHGPCLYGRDRSSVSSYNCIAFLQVK